MPEPPETPAPFRTGAELRRHVTVSGNGAGASPLENTVPHITRVKRVPHRAGPENPCRVVKIADDEEHVVDIVVIDAVEGKVLGHGVPPS